MSKPTPAPVPRPVAHYLACCFHTATPLEAPDAPEPWPTIMAAVESAGDKHEALRRSVAEAGLNVDMVLEAADKEDHNAPAPAAVPSEPAPGADGEPWEAPLPFDVADDLPPWPTHAMPTVLAAYVAALATSLQVPPDLPGILVLGVLAVTCQKRVSIELKEGWNEPLSLYLCAILPPGERKSPTVAKVITPLETWEREQADAVREQSAAATTKRSILEKSLEAAKAAASKAPGNERQELIREAELLAKELEEAPIPFAPRLLADDCTPESLQSLMFKHGGRMGVLSAEPTVFEHMGGKYAREGHSSLGVYLAGYSGDTLRVDRKDRTEFIERPALTIAVAAQPEALRGRFLNREFQGRGAVARFLMCIPHSLLGRRQTDAPAPADHIVKSYESAVQSLLNLTTAGTPQALRLAPEAVPEWIAYQDRIEKSFNVGGDLEPSFMQAWGAKLAGTVGRIAGLLHMAEHAWNPTPWTVPVRLETLRQAIKIGDYFPPHVRAVYGLAGADPRKEGAVRILGKLEELGLAEVSAADLWQDLRRSFRVRQDFEPSLRLLEKHGFLRRIRAERKVGRPSDRFHVHPTLVKRTQNTRNPHASPHSVDSVDGFHKREEPA